MGRKDRCGNPVGKGKYCKTNTDMYIWEAYMMQKNIEFDDFVLLKPPFSEAYAVGAEGIVMRVLLNNPPGFERKRLWSDYHPTTVLQTGAYDYYAENQWSSVERTFGPVGVIRNHVNQSNVYTSLIEEDGIGILCIHNYIFISAFWYGTGSAQDYATVWYKLYFRPRKVSRLDLIYYLLGDPCSNRVSCRKDDVVVNPCIDDDNWAPGLADRREACKENDDPEKEVVVNSRGLKVKCKDITKHLDDRSTYVPDFTYVKVKQDGTECIKICTTGSSTDPINITGTVAVSNIAAPVEVTSANSIPVSVANVQVPVSVTNAQVPTKIIQDADECLKVCSSGGGVGKVNLQEQLLNYLDSIRSVLNETCQDPELPCSTRDQLITYLGSLDAYASDIVSNKFGCNNLVGRMFDLMNAASNDFVKRKLGYLLVGLFYIMLEHYGFNVRPTKNIFLHFLKDEWLLDKGILMFNHFMRDSDLWKDIDAYLENDLFQKRPTEPAEHQDESQSSSMEIDPGQCSQEDSGIDSGTVRKDSGDASSG